MKENVLDLRKCTLKYLRVMGCDVSKLLSNSSEKNIHKHTHMHTHTVREEGRENDKAEIPKCKHM